MVDYKYTEEKWLRCSLCGKINKIFLDHGQYIAICCGGAETIMNEWFDPVKEGLKVEEGTVLEYLQKKYPGENI